jgi:hypothetical protein
MKVYPRCKRDWAQTYVSAEGYVMPCCWVGNAPDFKEYLDLYSDVLESLSVNNRPLSEILKDPIFRRIEQSWSSSENIFKPCLRYCSTPTPTEDKSYDGSNETLIVSLE